MPCPICDDTFWKIVECDGTRRAVRCDCWREAAMVRALEDARIPRRYEHCDFDSFVTYPNEKLQNVIASARRFAASFPVADKGLFLIGPPGIGKSHLAVAVLKAVIRTRGARGLFYDVRELLKMIRSTYDPVVKTTETEVLRPVMHTDLLVLDDIGAEKTSEWVEETLNLIVNTRYSERRLTIFTSNYEEKEDRGDPDSLLARVGFRMHSRLYEMCEFLEFDGADFRHAPTNATGDDLAAMWAVRQKTPSSGLPRRSGHPIRAQLRKPGGDLAWPGGRAGTGHGS
jgi:DNA replication protein DnaC